MTIGKGEKKMNCSGGEGRNYDFMMGFGGGAIGCLLPALYDEIKKRREKGRKIIQISREK